MDNDIKNWWDQNPFTFGAATNDYKKNDLVGRVTSEKMDLDYFNEIERRFRKHSGTGGQEKGDSLLSKLIDYKTSVQEKDVLDIAIGSGLHTVAFAKEKGRVTGIDLTPYAVKQAKKNLELRGLSSEIRQMDAQQMDFKDDMFDFVNAWGCLMHMPDTKGAIKEIYRVLKPGGRVLAYMYNKSSWPFWFNIFFLRGILLLGFIRYGFSAVRLTSRYSDGSRKGGNALTKFFTSKEAGDMFIEAGFEKIEAYPWDIGYEPDGWPIGKFPIFKYLPRRVRNFMAKNWGYGLIVRAQKRT